MFCANTAWSIPIARRRGHNTEINLIQAKQTFCQKSLSENEEQKKVKTKGVLIEREKIREIFP
jgi:hypothetical protein